MQRRKAKTQVQPAICASDLLQALESTLKAADRRSMRFLSALALLGIAATVATSAEVSGNAQAGGKPVANAVIWLDAPGAPVVAAKRVVLDQRNLDFNPHVLVVRVGTTV